jgi:hypothetical protein
MAKKLANGTFVWSAHEGTHLLGVYFDGYIYISKNKFFEGSGAKDEKIGIYIN